VTDPKVPATKPAMERYAGWLQEFLAMVFRPAGPRPVVVRAGLCAAL